MKITNELLKSLIDDTSKIFENFDVICIECLKNETNSLFEFDIFQIIIKYGDSYFCSFVSNNIVIPEIYEIPSLPWLSYNKINKQNLKISLDEINFKDNFVSIEISEINNEIIYSFVNYSSKVIKYNLTLKKYEKEI